MYKSFFGLRDNPFNGNPDPRYLYLTSHTRKALELLKNGVQCRKGLILLTGEVGTGKTTLVNYLLNWLRAQGTPTAFIFNSHLNVNHLLDFILTDFGVPIDFRLNGNMLIRLSQWLLEQFRIGKKPVLIVDEAQGLSGEALEEIRLLLNLETDSEKILQVILVGQPELEAKLIRPELSQLRQRIDLRCCTAPLRLQESHSYISERLRIAGANGNPIFPAETMDLAHFYSKGIPRVLNLLCEHALINAFTEESHHVPTWAVEEAALDFLLTDICSVPARRRVSDAANESLREMNPRDRAELVHSLTIQPESLRYQPSVQSSSLPAAVAIQQRLPTTNAKSVGFTRALIDTRKFVLESLTRFSSTAQQNRHLVFLVKTFRGWALDFRCDWKRMVNSIDVSTMTKSLSQWLRRPAASKRLNSSRKHAV